jgi:hypothetical protein
MRFEDLMVVNIKTAVCWDMTSCSLVEMGFFQGPCCLHGSRSFPRNVGIVTCKGVRLTYKKVYELDDWVY